LAIKEKELFDDNLAQTNYEYTISMTIFVHQDTCSKFKALKAHDECHLILFEESFMLYFSKPNYARFHFFAGKNYFESQTPQFFVPFN
jgi:hypothetical protein